MCLTHHCSSRDQQFTSHRLQLNIYLSMGVLLNFNIYFEEINALLITDSEIVPKKYTEASLEKRRVHREKEKKKNVSW